MNEIMVSVICTAYNHQEYIRQTLESFIMQKANFKFEVLINDDASTDNTAKIIKEFEKKYPDIIFPVYQEKNIYSQGIDPTRILIEKARGKYIAFCEGDDYWTDENKLQMQYEILESHPECVACVHNVKVDDETGSYPIRFIHSQDLIFGKEHLENETRIAHTCSYFFEKTIIDNMNEVQRKEFWELKSNGDLRFSAVILCNGLVYHIAKEMACYRYVVSHGDSWSAKSSGKNAGFSVCRMLYLIKDYCCKYYNVHLTYGEFFDLYLYAAVVMFIKHPSKENFWRLKEFLQREKYPFIRTLKIFIRKIYK